MNSIRMTFELTYCDRYDFLKYPRVFMMVSTTIKNIHNPEVIGSIVTHDSISQRIWS